ncbi:MAG: hypothetical protein JWO79_1865 [Actinomycetia bacterium]|nr:hypothetical protein [Actinomycetes bacterium]MDQ1658865.1 hypothetical protein [Cryptosporangiaceae bacterium]
MVARMPLPTFRALLCATVVAVMAALLPAAPASAVTLTYYTYELRNVNSGLCLEIDNWMTSEMTRATQNACDRSAPQQWRYSDVPGQATRTEMMTNENSRLCLGIFYYRKDDYAQAGQWACNTSDAQFWRFDNFADGTYQLVNYISGKCLDVADWNTRGDAVVQQYTCHGGANQRWAETAIRHSINIHLGGLSR